MPQFDIMGAIKEGYSPKEIAAYMKEQGMQEDLAALYKAQNTPKQNIRPVRSLTPQESSDIQQSVVSVPDQSFPLTETLAQTPDAPVRQFGTPASDTSIFPTPSDYLPTNDVNVDNAVVEAPRFVGRAAYSAAGGLTRAAQGGLTLIRDPGLPTPANETPVIGTLKRAADAMKWMQSGEGSPLAVSKEQSDRNPVISTVGQVGESLADFGGKLAVSGGAMPIMGGLSGLAHFAESRDKALENGASEQDATQMALPGAAVDAATFMAMPAATGPAKAIMSKGLSKIPVIGTLSQAANTVTSQIVADTAYMTGQGVAIGLTDKAAGISPEYNPAEQFTGKNMATTAGQAALFAMMHAFNQPKLSKERGLTPSTGAEASSGFNKEQVSSAFRNVDPATYTAEQAANLYDGLKSQGFTDGELVRLNPAFRNVFSSRTGEGTGENQKPVEKDSLSTETPTVKENLTVQPEPLTPKVNEIVKPEESSLPDLAALQVRRSNLETSIFNADGTQKPNVPQRRIDNYTAITATIEKLQADAAPVPAISPDVITPAADEAIAPEVNESVTAADTTVPSSEIETSLAPGQQEFVKSKVEKLGGIEAVKAAYPDQTAVVDQYALKLAEQMFASQELTTKPVDVNETPVVETQTPKPLLPMQKGKIKALVTKLGSSEAVAEKYGTRLDDPADLVAQHAKEVAAELYPEGDKTDGVPSVPEKAVEPEEMLPVRSGVDQETTPEGILPTGEPLQTESTPGSSISTATDGKGAGDNAGVAPLSDSAKTIRAYDLKTRAFREVPEGTPGLELNASKSWVFKEDKPVQDWWETELTHAGRQKVADLMKEGKGNKIPADIQWHYLSDAEKEQLSNIRGSKSDPTKNEETSANTEPEIKVAPGAMVQWKGPHKTVTAVVQSGPDASGFISVKVTDSAQAGIKKGQILNQHEKNVKAIGHHVEYSGDVPVFGGESQPEKSLIERELDAISDDDITDMISSLMDTREDTPSLKENRKKRVKTAIEHGAKPKTTSLLSSAAKEAGQGFADSLKALAAAYGVDESKLLTFPPGFDSDGYAKAKPHFESAWQHYKAAGKSLKEFVEYLVKHLGKLINNFEQQLAYFMGEMKGKHSFEADLKAKQAEYKTPDQRPVVTEEQLHKMVPGHMKASIEESQTRPETHLIDTPERAALRIKVVDDLYGTGAHKKGRRADIILGLAASGKSTVANPLVKEHGSLLIDADMAKEALPEFESGAGANAVHIESSKLAEQVLAIARLNGDDIVLPLVGGKLSSLEERITALVSSGYEVHLHYVDLPMEKSIERVISRYQEEGRLVDPILIVKNGLQPWNNFGIVRSKGGVNRVPKNRLEEIRGESSSDGQSGVDGLDRYTGDGRGRGGIPSSAQTEGQPAATYRIESASLYDNDVQRGEPARVIFTETNPNVKPEQNITSRGDENVSSPSNESTGTGSGTAAPVVASDSTPAFGNGTTGDVAGEQPAAVQKPVQSGDNNSAVEGSSSDAGESYGPGSGHIDTTSGTPRSHADVRPPSHVTGSSRNFTITNELDFSGVGSVSKFRNNVAAIKLVKQIISEFRPATPEEQSAIAHYVGWGGLANSFDAKKKEFSAELASLLTPQEYEMARASTRNAHYTAAEIVKGMWSAAKRLGFDRGSVLESSVGTGNVFGLMPKELRSLSNLTGIELDPMTAMIAKLLYPQASIHNKGLQEMNLAPGSYDLSIGNPPFAADSIFDPNDKLLSKFNTHGYFFARQINALRPGGILVNVVSSSLMDSKELKGPKQRAWMGERVKLLGAIRLPNTAFKANAGTDVTTDIIFMQKLAPGEKSNIEEWNNIETVKDRATGGDIPLNKYFVDHPEMMLGEMTLGGKMYRGGSTTLAAREGDNLPELLQAAIEKLPQGVMKSGSSTAELIKSSRSGLTKAAEVRPYNYFVEDGKVYQRMPDVNGDISATPVVLEGRTAERVSSMIEIRDAVRRQLLLESGEKSSTEMIEQNRKRLNFLYDNFVKKNGHLNNETNKRLFWEDADSPLVRSLEKSFDKGVSKDIAKKSGKDAREPSAKKADIFDKRVLSPTTEVTKVESAPDALAASMNEKGRVDFEYMKGIYSKDEAQIISELGDSIFDDPNSGWQVASQYLSGNVKAKLAEALISVKTDSKYNRNVEALDKVQPPDVPAADIYIAPHSFWIPESVFHQFAEEVLGGKMTGGYSRATAKWNVQFSSSDNTINYTKYGTQRMSATTIMANLMANKQVAVYDKGPDDTRILNPGETAAAQGKADELTELFQDWIWKGQERRQQVVRIYNDRMNTTVEAKHDGSHMSFPGMSPAFVFRPHQSNVTYRSIQNGVVLLDHVVGSGKTAVITATAMELRRLGLARKPMITVPNHLVEQWSASFAKIYPNAKILAATKKDFEGPKRRQLFAKIATGDWDAVIIAHSSFKFIPVPRDIEMEILGEQKAEIIQAIEEAKADSGKKFSVKDLEAARERVENKLKALADMPKDDLINFQEMGVDALFVDEAHEFKNLFYTTSMQNVAGLGNQKGSGRAFDMFVKTQYLMRRNGGKGVFFATGTPVSNSLAEVFHMQRFLQYSELKARGLHNFDAWSSAFGQATSDWEQDAGGRYKQKTRFRKLVNLPELKQLWGSITDTVTNPDLIRDAEEQGKRFPLPKIEGGKPKNVVVDRSPQQAEYIGVPRESKDDDGNVVINKENGMPVVEYDPGTIVYRMENWLTEFKSGNTREMPLVITGDARKAGLDFRLIDESAPDFAGSKVNTAVNEIYDIYKENDHRKGTQLVFIDLSTPKASKGKTMEKLAETVPTYFVKEHGIITHVPGKPVTLKAMPDEEFFYISKGSGAKRVVTVYERQSGLAVTAGDTVASAKEKAELRLTQHGGNDLVKRFRDLAIPSEKIDEYVSRWEEEQNKKEEDTSEEESGSKEEISFDDILADSGKSDFSVYDDIKTKLIAKGIPVDQIAFIHDANTDAQKHDLFAKVNQGIVRVLLGSTAKMGAGTNVQKKLVGLHHLDAPWKPSDLAQREGRIVRQGNEFYNADPDNFLVKIRRYATKQTYDSRMWEIIETKAKAIELFKTGGKDVREVEDVSSESANAAEIKASAAGNPLMLEDLQLKNEIKKYDAMEKSWKRSRYDLEDKVQSVEQKSAYPYKRLALLEKADKYVQEKNGESLGLKLGRVTYNMKEDFQPQDMFQVIGKAHTAALRDMQPFDIGAYRGMTLKITPSAVSPNKVLVSVVDPSGFEVGHSAYTHEDNFSAGGFVTRLDNIVDGLQNDITGAKGNIARLEKEADSARKELQEPFKHAKSSNIFKNKHKKVVDALRQGKTSVEETDPKAIIPIPDSGIILDSLGLQQIYERIAKVKLPKEATEDLRSMGAHIYAKGSTAWKPWFLGMKEGLGKLFNKFKAMLENIFKFVTEKMKEERGSFSTRKTRTGDPAIDAVLDKIGSKEKTMIERIKESLGNLAHKETRMRELEQGIFDKYASLRYLDKMAGVTRPDDSAYIAARMSTSLSDVMLAMLKHGHPVWKDGGSAVQGKGLVQIFKPVSEDLDQFLGWMVGERAQKLMDEGRERYFDQDEINILRGLKTTDNAARWELARKEYVQYKRKVLDFAEESGVINPDARKIWDHEEYVPFYRIVEDKPKGPFKTKGIASQSSGIQKLKGADERLGDIFENIVRNFTHLVDASIKNRATELAIQKAEHIGAAGPAPMEWKTVKINNQQIVDAVHEFFGETQEDVDMFVSPEDMEAFTTFFHPAKPQGKDVIHVLRNGKPEYFQIHDDLLLRSLTSINDQVWGGPAMSAMRFVKRMLTMGITSAPDFMIRNFVRDTLHTWTISRNGFTPVVSSLTGMVKAFREDDDMIQLMAAGGAFHGGYAYGNDPAAAKLMVEKLLDKKGIDKHTILDTPKKLWEFWQEIGGSMENAARVSTYKNTKADTGSHLQAAFDAKDIMDFSMRGDWAAINFLTQTVPFFGARLQGLQRLGKGMMENPLAFTLKGGLIALAAMALWLYNRLNPKYQELEEWDKDTYFHFFVGKKHFRLPKPFEVGAIFGTIPERMLELTIAKQHDGKLFAERMASMLTQTFAVGLPQIVNEPVQQWANKDFFTDRPIVGKEAEGLLPAEQSGVHTSATAKEAGRLTGVSPVRIEHAVKGYFGTLGTYVLGASDMMIRRLYDYPAQPSSRPEEWPVLRAFYKGEGPANNTKFTTGFYELLREVDQTTKTVEALRKTGEHDRADKLTEKELPKMAAKNMMHQVQKQLSEINKAAKMTHLDRTMTPSEKREFLDDLQVRKNELSRLAVEQAKENGAR